MVSYPASPKGARPFPLYFQVLIAITIGVILGFVAPSYGAAMKPLDNPAPFYWAPEVTCADGRFYLYYSVGNETLMEIHVAVSDRPDGGFVLTVEVPA